MPEQPFNNQIHTAMTSKLFSMIITAAMATACGSTEANQEGFATDSVAYEHKTHTSEVTLRADYPKGGNAILTNAISEYISEQLGGTYSGPLTTKDSLIAYYGRQQTTRLDEMAKDMQGSAAAPLYYSEEIKVATETDRYVTYTDLSESFMGGAHGISTMSGTTFRKSDGRRFGYEMLRNTNSDDFRALLKEGLRQYFTATGMEVGNDEQLAQLLLNNNGVDYLPLPQAAPYLTADGMAFVYQPYEIAPYAAGRPSFTIPYDKIRPFLTETIIKLLDNSN